MQVKAYLPMVARYIMAGILGWSFFENVMRHGELEPESRYNGWTALFELFTVVALLNMGGFWG